MLIVYLAMLAITLHSIFQDNNARSKAAWVAGVILVPILGMATYCLACLRFADVQFLHSLGLMKRQKPQL